MSATRIDVRAFKAKQCMEAIAQSIFYGRATLFELDFPLWLGASEETREEYRGLAKAVLFMETPKLLQFGTNGGRTIAPGLKATHGFDCYIGPPEAAK